MLSGSKSLYQELALGVLAASPDCVKLLSGVGVVLFINERGVELNQLDSADDVVGLNFAEMWPQDEQPKIRLAITGAAAGKIARMEGYCPTAKGEARWWDSSFSPLTSPDGRIEYIVSISRDVTERHVAESDRRAAEGKLRLLNADLEQQVTERSSERGTTWQVSPLLLSVIDMGDATFTRVNPAWERTLGWTEADMVGTAFLDFLHPDDVEGARKALADAQRGDAVLNLENRYRARDGSFRWLSWVAVPEAGKLYSNTRDITAEKEQARALAESQEALRQSHKMEAIGQLTGGVAHDFNNLLTVIRGSVDLLKRSTLSHERRARYIDAIGETADRAAKLTGQLLAFARRQALHPEMFDVEQSLDGVMGVISSLTGSRITVERPPAMDQFYVMADRSQFDTAIVNMVVNARDAMGGEGRIVITVDGADEVPAVRNHQPVLGRFVAVRIADTGKGIAEADLNRIFEPFFTTKDVGVGTGLGLSQVIGFAKQSEGEVRVESRLCEGTVFTLYLPRLAREKLVEKASEFIHREVAAEGICVLVVEDNRKVGEFATSALNEIGFESVLAQNAQEALAKLAEDCQRFHIVFSDVVMPGISGLEMAREIQEKYPGVPVILTSGYSHILAQSGSNGVELLQKPYSIEQLSQLLHKTLARAASAKTS